MNFTILSLLFLLLCMEAKSQTWDEWFHQGRTQQRYLKKQIALLKVYLEHVKEGYEIAQHGLTLIHDISNGDFALHKDYFKSLKIVSQHLSGSSKVLDIIAIQAQVLRGISDVNNFCRNNEHFTPEEVHYVTAVYANMLALTEKTITELLTIIRSGETEMTDDDRLRRIAELQVDMRDKQAFVKSLAADVRMVATERERLKNEIDLVRKQYELI